METLLVKIFATALALSQVTTAPDAVRPGSTATPIRPQVAQLLRAGCTHMRKAFDIEDINLDELIATAMEDPQAIAGESKAFRGINFADLQTAYRQFCKNEKVDDPGGRSRRRDRFLQQGAHRPARSQQAQGHQAARRQRGARPQGRALRGGVRGEPAPRLGGARRHSGARAEGVRGGGGQALLRAQGHRRARPDPRLHRQPRAVRPPAGRLDHHPADREEPAGGRGPDL